MEEAQEGGETWPARESSLPRRSSSTASHSAPARRMRKCTPSWLSRSASARNETTAGSSRRVSTSTTSSSTISTETCSSIDTGISENANIYQLPTISSDESETRDCGESPTFDSVNDATMALQSMAMSIPEDEEVTYQPGRRGSGPNEKDLPPLPRRPQSRARSTRSRVSRLSSIQNDETLGLAEIEMASRGYTGYWRASSIAHIPPAAAICGTMLLTAKLPARPSHSSGITTDEDGRDRAASLCEALDEAQSPEAALDALQQHSLATALLAIKQSFDAANAFTVPDKVAWGMYQKIAEARNHPDKINGLWDHMSKFVKRVPQNVVVVLVFLLSIARRLQSRGILVNGASPAVFLLQEMFPRYVAEDASRILLKNFENIPEDLPQVLESVNYRFGGRKCNILALVARKRDSNGPRSPGRAGVQEIRTSEEKEARW